MRMILLCYDLEVVYKPGKEMLIPDALSRAVLDDEPPRNEDEYEVMSVISQMPVTDNRLIELREKTAEDPVLQEVINLVIHGWPEVQIPHEVRPFHTFRNEITFCNGIPFRENQIIIPTVMRAEMLRNVHSSHQGIVKSKQRASDILARNE